MPSEKRVVHVIDDDEASRQSLAFLLQTATSRCRPTRRRRVSSIGFPNLVSGCVITDVRMPGMSGIDLLRRLQGAECRGAGHRDYRTWRRAAGGRGNEDRRGRLSGKAVRRRGAAGERAFGAGSGTTAQKQRQGERTEIEARLAALSNRERDVLAGLVAGRANKQIAYDLGISPRTVEIYRANLMNKMQAGSLSELVRMALIAGMLENG